MNEQRPALRADEPMPEGEERAPPGTRAMAIARWALVFLMAVVALGAWIHYGATSSVIAHVERFHCPMHPSVVMERKGECPICGMDLVLAGDGAREGDAHPPAAKAPGEHAGAVGQSAAVGARYTCPMHPEFMVDDPKARCPECGMKLVPKEDTPRAADGAGVPGLAPVELTVDRIQLIGMRTALAAREPLAPTIRTVGFVAAPETGLVSVTARYTGWIEALAVSQTGQLVEKGELLATVYSPELLTAQRIFLNALRWEGAGGPPAAAPASAELDRDPRQRLELLGIAPRDIDAIAKAGKTTLTVNVRSPVRGHVARKAALKGLFVQPGTELFQIADLSTLWVLAEVYESEIGRVEVGQRATLELAAYPGERFPGRVQFIYPAVNPGSRTLQARLEFQNPAMKLRPGMYGDVTLELGQADAVVVPRDAVIDTGELQYVFLAAGGGRYLPRRVRTGRSAGGKVAIVDGLREGERVVTTANFLLDSESRLRAAIDGAP